MLLPIVALVGRSNVGKSTLFNRLTHTNNALVTDLPGLTRDRQYGIAKITEYKFIIIDTGGINLINSNKGIESYIIKQSMSAIEESDIVFFLVDGHTGPLPVDWDIINYLRTNEKQIFLIINKIDGLNVDIDLTDFYALGLKNIYLISALRGTGIANLLKRSLLPIFIEGEIQLKYNNSRNNSCSVAHLCLPLEQKKNKGNFVLNQSSLPIKLAIVGRPNVGKSTLINTLLGKERVIVYDMPYTTRDSIYIPMNYADRQYVLIDTAGIRKQRKINNNIEKLSIIKALNAIENANVVMLIIDACIGTSDQDLSLLSFILRNGRSFLIVVNKWDLISTSNKKLIKKNLINKLKFVNFARIHFISALNKKGIDKLFESINETYDCSVKRLNTAKLTRIMRMASNDHHPPLIHGRRVKLKYAHICSYNPLMITIHGNQVKRLPNSYKRYLINYFSRSCNMVGTLINIKFKETHNPYSSI